MRYLVILICLSLLPMGAWAQSAIDQTGADHCATNDCKSFVPSDQVSLSLRTRRQTQTEYSIPLPTLNIWHEGVEVIGAIGNTLDFELDASATSDQNEIGLQISLSF